jgi:MFS family permease
MMQSSNPSIDQTSSAQVVAALRDLVAEGTLTEVQAARVADRLGVRGPPPQPGTTPVPERGGRLAEIAGYIGGALLLGAAALFLIDGWDDLSEATRVVILAALAVLLLVAGGLVALSSGQSITELGDQVDSARRRLVSVLWTFAAAAAAGAAGLGASGWELVAASAVGLLVTAVTYAFVPSVVGQLGMWAASVALATGLVAQIGDEPGTGSYAVTLVALGGGWVASGLTHRVRDREVALATGVVIALVGAQLPVISGDERWVSYVLTAVVALAGFVGYLSTRSWSVLGAGVLATTLVVPEALNDWTGGSVSAAGSLLVAGLTLLAASAAGLRLRREVR